MKKSTKVILVVVLLVFLLFSLVGAGLGLSYVLWRNYGAVSENAIKATWANNINVLGQYTLKIQEAAGVPSMYKDDLYKILKVEMSSRYGSTGSRASMQWIKERSLNYDASMYNRLQQLIAAGREEFQVQQTRLIDQKRAYQNNLDTFWSGFWLSAAGYPKIDLTKLQPVVAEDTQQIFNKGTQKPITLRTEK